MEGGWRQDYQRYKSFFLNVVSQYQKRGDVKAYLEILLSLTTVSLLAIFAIRPTFTTIAQLIKEIQGKEETLATMNEKIDNLKTAQNLYNNEIDRINLLKSAIPDNPTPDVLARQIEGLSAKDQVTIQSMGVKEAVLSGPRENTNANSSEQTVPLPENSGALGFTINSRADFQQLFNLLNDMEILRRPIKFDLLQLRKTETETGETLFMNIEARVPFFHKLNTKKQ